MTQSVSPFHSDALIVPIPTPLLSSPLYPHLKPYSPSFPPSESYPEVEVFHFPPYSEVIPHRPSLARDGYVSRYRSPAQPLPEFISAANLKLARRTLWVCIGLFSVSVFGMHGFYEYSKDEKAQERTLWYRRRLRAGLRSGVSGSTTFHLFPIDDSPQSTSLTRKKTN